MNDGSIDADVLPTLFDSRTMRDLMITIFATNKECTEFQEHEDCFNPRL